MKPPNRDDYLGLFRLYRDALGGPAGPGGERLRFLFERVVRMLSLPSPFNTTLPAPFLDVARRHTHGEPATLNHFNHDENRQFFLSDLYDFIQLQRGRRR